MPLITRNCPECHYQQEDILEWNDQAAQESVECPKCHNQTFIRQIVSGSFRIMGPSTKNGW